MKIKTEDKVEICCDWNGSDTIYGYPTERGASLTTYYDGSEYEILLNEDTATELRDWLTRILENGTFNGAAS